MIETALELFRRYFFWIDFAIGGGAPVLAYALYRLGKIDRFMWALFWVGVGLGLLWEVPMSTLTTFSETAPVHYFVRPMPANFVVWIVLHSFWDGGLFLIGAWVTNKLCPAPTFERFSARELGVLIVWGQVSELWVEMTSITGDAWIYIPYPWNPPLFKYMGRDVTLMPQLIWLAAPIAFYFIALRLKRKL